jgi:hypothetical protein
MLASDYTLNQQEANSKQNLMIISENEMNNEYVNTTAKGNNLTKFSNLITK